MSIENNQPSLNEENVRHPIEIPVESEPYPTTSFDIIFQDEWEGEGLEEDCN